jgi:hypothetical protein
VNLGTIGIWTSQLDFVPAAVACDAVAQVEELGYGTLWFGENVGRDPVAQAGLVLAATKRLTVATGIMNIRARDPLATTAAQLTLARPCPPLFPDAGGRHLQRAFRDALADLVPLEHGWLPTLRIAD